MNLTNMEMGLMVIEGSILVSFLITLLAIKRSLAPLAVKRALDFPSSPKNPSLDIDKLKELLRESESISLNLTKNLEEKKEIAKRLMATLDEKIQSLNRLLEKTKEKNFPSVPLSPEKDAVSQILEMALSGCGIAEIARRLGLSKEEVQLILDLKKINAN